MEQFTCVPNQEFDILVNNILDILADTVSPTENDQLPDLGKDDVYERAVAHVIISPISLKENTVMGWMTRSSVCSVVADNTYVKERIWHMAKTVEKIETIKNMFTDTDIFEF